MLKDNGGLRREYSCKVNGDRVFRDSLRNEQKRQLKYFRDKPDITDYLNWDSKSGRRTRSKNAEIQRDLVSRLTKGSPNRATTIRYVVGQGKVGDE